RLGGEAEAHGTGARDDAAARDDVFATLPSALSARDFADAVDSTEPPVAFATPVMHHDQASVFSTERKDSRQAAEQPTNAHVTQIASASLNGIADAILPKSRRLATLKRWSLMSPPATTEKKEPLSDRINK